jgi:hypothetical protein
MLVILIKARTIRIPKIETWFKPLEVRHGPHTQQAWYKLCTFSWIKLLLAQPSWGYRLWIYRNNKGVHIDIYFNERSK